MKKVPSLIALAAISMFGISCKSNKTAQNSTQQGAQAYGTSDDYYGSNGEYDNVYASGGGQSYEDASAYENNTDAYGGAADYGSGSDSSSGGGAASSGGGQSHTVQKGDTLFSLSRRYGTTVGAIQSANGLNGDLIRIGQSLMIP